MTYSDETKLILITIYTNGSIDKNQLSYSALRNLFNDHYIANSNNYRDNSIYLTDKGKAYVESIIEKRSEKKFQHIHTWINTCIAAMSLIVAIIALILSLTR